MFSHVFFECIFVTIFARVSDATRRRLSVLPHRVVAAVRCPDNRGPAEQLAQWREVVRVCSMRPQAVERQLVLGRTAGTAVGRRGILNVFG